MSARDELAKYVCRVVAGETAYAAWRLLALVDKVRAEAIEDCERALRSDGAHISATLMLRTVKGLR